MHRQTFKTERMRKILLLMMMMVSVAVSSQTLTRSKVLKSTDLGNQKLQMAIQKNDTVYAIVLKNSGGGSRDDVIVVALGNRQNALRLLNVMLDVELEKDDVLALENETNNVVKKWPLAGGGFAVFHELGVRYGQLRKPNIKGFIKVLQGEEKQPVEQEEKDTD